MAFAFMDIQKIKTEGQMTAKYNHNCRKIEIDNVIPELSHLNEDLIPLPVDQNGNELSYYDAFKKRINELPYYQDHNIRKNAVRGYEVLLTFSKDESINVDEWKKLSVKWLKDTFNVAPDKRNNVLHVAFHADETGNYHCHAFVVPIDEKGKLNNLILSFLILELLLLALSFLLLLPLPFIDSFFINAINFFLNIRAKRINNDTSEISIP